ncbi:uncharacterized protein LOC142231074 [Haematobia irritans]|uniref:uncharacterized protein LOC142231074 n=1 Tax=Haematobia irritans TaxID=7368 RepID=UPI003F508F0F
MENCKPSSTPIPPGTILKKCEDENCNEIVDSKCYQSLIGSLMYLATISRPDISHTISKLSQFNSHPHREHMTAAKHVLRYLKAHKFSLTFDGADGLCCFSDADWGSNAIDRKSYSGYVLFFAGGPIAWESKKQDVVALSSMEAEYIAMSQAVKEISFHRSLLMELELEDINKKPTTLYCDNQGAQYLTKSHMTLKRNLSISAMFH